MNMNQLLESLCNGQFLTKLGNEALEFYAYVVDLAKGWEESQLREMGRMRQPPNTKGGITM